MCVFKYLMNEEMVCHIDCHVGQGDCGVGKGRVLRLQWSFGHHLHHLSGNRRTKNQKNNSV